MKKTRTYYVYLLVVFVYLVFSVSVRDQLINYVLGIDINSPVTDSDLYQKENIIRTSLTYVLLGLLFLELIVSMIFLSIKNHSVPKWLLIVVIVLIIGLFGAVYSVGGFV